MTPGEAEQVVRGARPPFPRETGEDKFLVWGQTDAGRYLQVVFVRPDHDEVDPESLDLSELIDYSEGAAEVIYVIHAMELDDSRKRRYRQLRSGS